MTIIETTYGLGGCDTTHPDYPKDSLNGNVVEQVEDNGDGTHTRTVFDEKGNVADRETYPVDVPPPPPLTAEEKVAELAALLVEKGHITEAEVAAKLERAEVKR